MNKTKRLICMLLSVLLIHTIIITSSITAFAFGGIEKAAKAINLNETYTSAFTKNNHEYREDFGCDVFYLTLPADGTITVYIEAESEDYLALRNVAFYDEHSTNDRDDYIENCKFGDDYKYNYNEGVYFNSKSAHLKKGSYYAFSSFYSPYVYKGYFDGTYDIRFTYKADVQKPTTLKVTSRNTTSLKLLWNKASGVEGYQLQRKVGNTYKTLTNTTATSYTVKELSSATNYAFRVRAYKTIEGKKYYSSWKTLTTPTKPAKVSIKTPTTNSNHQIIAKWNKVSRATGYQVQYCKNKSCSNVISTKTVSGQSKVSYTGKNFTKNKTYYVRVRAYKTINNTKYYGAWSNVKSIKCK